MRRRWTRMGCVVVGLWGSALGGCDDGGAGTGAAAATSGGGDGGSAGGTTSSSSSSGGDAGGGMGGALPTCAENEDCDDSDACTTDRCVQEQCDHAAVSVDDGDACTADSCDPVTGVAHAPVVIDDGDVCTDDSCDPTTGVSYTPVVIDDGDACTDDSCDPVTGVAHTPVVIDDGDVCTDDSCDPAIGVSNIPVIIDDGDACTADSCDPVTGVAHTPVVIDDGDACTTDGCDPATGVAHVFVDIEDGDACTADSCDPITGVAHTPVTIDDSTVCTTDSCDPRTGVAHVFVDIEDDDACTADSCDPITGVAHTPVNIDDSTVCTTDSCDPRTGVAHVAVVIDDGNACTADSCDPVTGVAHAPVPIDDSNACTADSCNPSMGVSHTPVPIDDSNACTADSCNPSTGVSHTPVPIDDSNACTADSCNPSTGVAHTPVPIDDGNACTTDSCNPSTGVRHAPVVTDDGIACTDDTCDPVAGVRHVPVNSRCELDGYSCTSPTCSATTGCSETPNDSVCNDGIACTGPDRCRGPGGAAGTGCERPPVDVRCQPLEVCDVSGCVPSSPEDQLGDVIVSEIWPIGTELVELHNTTSAPVDVRGFVLRNLMGQTADVRAATDRDGLARTPVVIPAGGYAYGVPNPAASGSVPADAAFVYGAAATSFSLSDVGDVLILYSRDGQLLEDQVDFTNLHTDPTTAMSASAFPFMSGVSTQLDPAHLSALGNDSGAHWCTTFYPDSGVRRRGTTTAGAANGSCRTAVINEVLVDAFGSDDGKAFVEIAGPGGADVGGVRIEDVEGRGSTSGFRNTESPSDVGDGEIDGEVILPAGTRIPVDGFLIVADGTNSGTSGFSGTLVSGVTAADVIVRDMDPENSTNGGDALQLVAADGTLLDALGHSATGGALDLYWASFNGLIMYETEAALFPTVGASIARDPSSQDTDNNRNDFHGDPSPTPGAASDAVNVTLAAVSPNNGLATVATTITLTGSDFATGATLALGSTTLSCTTLTSATTMTCTAPSNGGVVARLGAAVTNPANVGGSATLPGAFTYTGVLNESSAAAEADYCVVQFPTSFSVRTRRTTPVIYGRLFEFGVTEPAGAPPGLIAELGYGAQGSSPTAQAGWLYFPASFNTQVGNDDELQASFVAPATAAVYSYVYRFSLDGGLNYTYCDTDGSGSNAGLTFNPAMLGTMTVTP
jgi:hypothetical protein